MTSLSIFTSMTKPEERKYPWSESLSCYEDFADEVIVVEKIGLRSLSGIILEKYFRKGSTNLLKIG